MYIDFEYPRYGGRISAIFENKFNENTQCNHGYAYFQARNNCAHGLLMKVGQ